MDEVNKPKSTDSLVQRMAQRVDPDRYRKFREGFAGQKDGEEKGTGMWDALKARARKLID